MKIFSYATILWFVIFTCVSRATADGDDDECELPPAQQDIEWSKMTGVWYEILNVRTPSDELVPCFQIRDIRSTSNGISYMFKDTGRNTNVTIDAIKQNSGGFVYNQEHVGNWMNYLKDEIKPSQEPSPELLEESLDTFFDEFRYFTDYENYAISLLCTKKGKKLYWIASRTNSPNAITILKIFNKLIKVKKGWNNVPLYFSGCVDFENNE